MSSSKSLNKVEFFGRGYNEYMQLFNLNESDFVGKKILDVNAGPSSFTATMNNIKRFNVIACDVLYDQSIEQLTERHNQAMESIKTFIINDEHDQNLWNQDYWNDKTNALNCFLDDYGRRNGHYVHAELPVLPFPDQLFDIVLSSHFLFIYSSSEEGGVLDTNRYNIDFHLKAITELARVCKSKLLICPVSTMTHFWDKKPMNELTKEAKEHCQTPEAHTTTNKSAAPESQAAVDHPYLAKVTCLLNGLGFSVTKEKSNYQYYDNVDMLIAERLPKAST